MITTKRMMNTFSGISFDPLYPEKENMTTEDIAHALSLICRANGHTRYFYSVAQHSINCSVEAEKRNYSTEVQLGALLHDASEAYISDIVRPVKYRLQTYRSIEETLHKVIYEAYGLQHLSREELLLIAEIDNAMLGYELEHLLSITSEYKQTVIGQHDLSFSDMTEVKQQFIERVEYLQSKLT